MKVVITTAIEDAHAFEEALLYLSHEVIQAPLKYYEIIDEDELITETFEGFSAYKNVIHGSKRNTEFFWMQVEKFNKVEELKTKLNFVIDPLTQDFLEKKGVPAVLPHAKAKPIDVLEFMIRFKRMGTTLYPAGDNTREEMPGLLEELGVAYNDLTVFRERGLTEDEVSNTLIDLQSKDWDGILFHSRSSVNRFFALAPEYDFTSKKVFALNQTVDDRLKEFGMNDALMLESDLKNIPSD